MNKKVIIITQDLEELPFDIKSYRAIKYSLNFNKLPELIKELRKLLLGAIDDSVKYGNPVSDYIPNFYINEITKSQSTDYQKKTLKCDSVVHSRIEEEGEKGLIDFIADIEENSEKMTKEISSMGSEMSEMNSSISKTSREIDRVKALSGNVDANFVRTLCRKLSKPIDEFASNLKSHVTIISGSWDIVENSYLSLLDNPHTKTAENASKIKKSMLSLAGMRDAIKVSDEKIEGFIIYLRGSMGMERRLNKAISSLISELEGYLLMTETMASSIDRITSRGEIVTAPLELEKE